MFKIDHFGPIYSLPLIWRFLGHFYNIAHRKWNIAHFSAKMQPLSPLFFLYKLHIFAVFHPNRCAFYLHSRQRKRKNQPENTCYFLTLVDKNTVKNQCFSDIVHRLFHGLFHPAKAQIIQGPYYNKKRAKITKSEQIFTKKNAPSSAGRIAHSELNPAVDYFSG